MLLGNESNGITFNDSYPYLIVDGVEIILDSFEHLEFTMGELSELVRKFEENKGKIEKLVNAEAED